jgi:hypothetical protein
LIFFILAVGSFDACKIDIGTFISAARREDNGIVPNLMFKEVKVDFANGNGPKGVAFAHPIIKI